MGGSNAKIPTAVSYDKNVPEMTEETKKYIVDTATNSGLLSINISRTHPQNQKLNQVIYTEELTHLVVGVCDPFAICLLSYHCFSRTYMPSVALHVVEFTFSRGFESYLRSHSFLGLPANPQKESGSNKGHVKLLNGNRRGLWPG